MQRRLRVHPPSMQPAEEQQYVWGQITTFAHILSSYIRTWKRGKKDGRDILIDFELAFNLHLSGDLRC